MIPLDQLEQLAADYVRDRDRRAVSPLATKARGTLDKGCRILLQAADVIGDHTRDELALVGHRGRRGGRPARPA
jgi:hypothetical protein